MRPPRVVFSPLPLSERVEEAWAQQEFVGVDQLLPVEIQLAGFFRLKPSVFDSFSICNCGVTREEYPLPLLSIRNVGK